MKRIAEKMFLCVKALISPTVRFFNPWTNYPVFQAGGEETEASWVKEIELKRASPPGGSTPVRTTSSHNP